MPTLLLLVLEQINQGVMAVEALVGSIAEKLVSLAEDAIAGQLRVAWGLKGGLEKLNRRLKRIQSKLADAEEKQTVDADVRTWLDALKKVAYEAEDVLDELNYETLRHNAAEVVGDKAPCSGKVRDFFSSHNPMLIRLKMGRKINTLLQEIDEIASESTKFNFSEVGHAQPETTVMGETFSLVKESDVVGRHGVKEQIVNTLINSHCNAENVVVLPIVGMGGIGKTTLAKLVYSDTRVVDYFQLRVWVCVSDRWDTKKIIQDILSLATTKECRSSTMEGLHLALREALTHRRFLIVLDDVWEEDDASKWGALKGILDHGGKGSAVIVTTRSDRVSQITGTFESCRLSCLSIDESWDLFSKRAFAPRDEKPEELVEIGKAIANKCGGLPLALTMLGSLLYMKRDRRLWLEIKESNTWDIETGIIPALWMSYKHLPLHSKRCFAFCAVFPKDCEMDKEELINMWMAHGFIPSDGGRLEVKGSEIFNQLVQRSFLQDLKEEEDAFLDFVIRTTCRMHDLVHDLAQSIVRNECITLPPERAPKVAQLLKDVYHLSISDDIFDIKNTLKASPNLRTILPVGIVEYDGNIPGSTSLRVLKQYDQLPTSMKYVRHLRYLQLSTSLTELPESICTLLHLQTLDLSGCENLCRLPKRMACMISLRHLYLDDCDKLMIMAPGMGRMINLQTLTHYVVSEKSGMSIGELKELHLSSRLILKGLGFVKGAKEAREMNLHTKEDLTYLSLDWSMPEGGRGGEINNVEQVLEELKPPRFLKFFVVCHYNGLKFPTWMKDLQHLVKLHLENCTGSRRLPPLWQLNSLEEMYLEHMNNLEYIVSVYTLDDTTVQAFRSLKELKLNDLESLKDWWENENAPRLEGMANCFPALVNLTIRECPELAGSIPMAPCLKSLDLFRSEKMPLGSISSLTSLVYIEIVNPREEEHVHDPIGPFLPHDIVALRHLQCIKDLTIEGPHKVSLVWRHEDDEQEEEEEGSGHSSLKDLNLSKCNWIFSSPGYDGFWTCMASLESLKIGECNALVAFPYKALQGLKSLRELSIWNCNNMTDKSPAADLGSVFLSKLEVLFLGTCSRLETVPSIWSPSLKTLEIRECESLVSLAVGEQELGHLTSSSLERVFIVLCPRLEKVPPIWCPSLKTLYIEGCNNLVSLAAAEQELGSLSSLETMSIINCPRLESLPEGLLPTLKKLVITACPELAKKCARGGEYWSLVSHIPKRRIKSNES